MTGTYVPAVESDEAPPLHCLYCSFHQPSPTLPSPSLPLPSPSLPFLTTSPNLPFPAFRAYVSADLGAPTAVVGRCGG